MTGGAARTVGSGEATGPKRRPDSFLRFLSVLWWPVAAGVPDTVGGRASFCAPVDDGPSKSAVAPTTAAAARLSVLMTAVVVIAQVAGRFGAAR